MRDPAEIYDNEIVNWISSSQYVVPFVIKTNEGEIRNMEYVFYDKWDRADVIEGLQDVLDVPTFYAWPFDTPPSPVE